ncbi:hypothetical protein ACOMHN_059241 [Nucella lapillus]
MACTQEKCSSSHDDLKSSATAEIENDESVIFNKLNNSFHLTYHADMDDDSYTVAENVEISPINSMKRHFPIHPDDNTVNGLNDIAPHFSACTSTPCTVRGQSCLLDSQAVLSPDDSGLGSSLALYTPSSLRNSLTLCTSYTVDVPRISWLATSTHIQSLSSMQVDSPAPLDIKPQCTLSTTYSPSIDKNMENTYTPAVSSIKKGRQLRMFNEIGSLVLNKPTPFINKNMATTAVGSMEEVSPPRMFREREKDILDMSTPLSLSLGMGALVTSTPVDGDSPMPSQALLQHRQQTPISDDDSSMTGPWFQTHRSSSDSGISCSSFPPLPLPLWNSPSQLAWQEEEEGGETYFTSSGLFDKTDEDSNQSLALVADMKRVLGQFTPSVPDRLVGRMVGVEHVDIITELLYRNVPAPGVVAWLSPYLQPADYLRMSLVCRQWRGICLADKMVIEYRTMFMRIHNTSEKENRFAVKDKSGNEGHGMTRASMCLQNVQVAVAPPSLKHVLSSPDLYEKTRKNLRWEDLLRHCPVCHGVAKVKEGQDLALCQQCSYDFCTRCLSPFHPGVLCPPLPHNLPPRHHPGNKKSKKELRRINSLL